MHLWIARWLLLFALLGNFVPVALALSAAPPPHACCLRKFPQAHRCDGVATPTTEPSELAIRSTGCCNHDCCRAITVARWAQAEPVAAAPFVREIDTAIVFLHFDSPITRLSDLQSTRAPPQPSLA